MTKKVVVVYSGGMDSYTVLHKALATGAEVYAISFNYGQKHRKELAIAETVCKQHHITHKIVDISVINSLMFGSSLIDDGSFNGNSDKKSSSNLPIPEGHYKDDTMKSTVVPNRNMILISMAIAYAVSLEAEQVFYGAHSGDHHIYPDCRPEFVHAMNEVSLIANYQAVEIVAPFLNDSKGDILAAGLAMGLDYQNTWTCYNGREKPCGKCGACYERLEAFAENNCKDPLIYELA